MAIRRDDKEHKEEIKAGHWINATTVLTLLYCGRPLLVTKDVTKDRVWYRRPGWDADEPDKYMRRDSVVFICDTKEEATTMAMLAEQRRDEIAAAVASVEAKFEALFDQQVKGGDAAA